MFGRMAALDAVLRRQRRRVQVLVVTIAAGCAIAAGVPRVPSLFLDYSRLPLLSQVTQPGAYGSDTLSDMYEARVVLNNPLDMYTKREVEQTQQEAARWSREASGPYPPVALFILAGMAWLGGLAGVGLYGPVLALACLFMLGSAVYCLKTRWYVFPLMCVNATYIAERFVHVQDNSYLLLLVVMLGALFLARRGSPWAHALVALAITIKLSPVYYLKQLPGMPRWMAALVILIVLAALVLPVFIFPNYLYIYQFHTGRKAHYWMNTAGTLLVVIPFTLALAYVEARRGFDWEDRVGWAAVPFALFLAMSLNAPRHLFLVLLLPDKRAMRTIAGTLGMAVHLVAPSLGGTGTPTYVTLALLCVVLAAILRHGGENSATPFSAAVAPVGSSA
jgi:hypothetical protein